MATGPDGADPLAMAFQVDVPRRRRPVRLPFGEGEVGAAGWAWAAVVSGDQEVPPIRRREAWAGPFTDPFLASGEPAGASWVASHQEQVVSVVEIVAPHCRQATVPDGPPDSCEPSRFVIGSALRIGREAVPHPRRTPQRRKAAALLPGQGPFVARL
ncbi:MAG: hypothetical protein ACRDJH_04700 [Thermomicrobiales bacterium]